MTHLWDLRCFSGSSFSLHDDHLVFVERVLEFIQSSEHGKQLSLLQDLSVGLRKRSICQRVGCRVEDDVGRPCLSVQEANVQGGSLRSMHRHRKGCIGGDGRVSLRIVERLKIGRFDCENRLNFWMIEEIVPSSGEEQKTRWKAPIQSRSTRC